MRPQDLETLQPYNFATFRPLEVTYCIEYSQILKTLLQKTLFCLNTYKTNDGKILNPESYFLLPTSYFLGRITIIRVFLDCLNTLLKTLSFFHSSTVERYLVPGAKAPQRVRSSTVLVLVLTCWGLMPEGMNTVNVTFSRQWVMV